MSGPDETIDAADAGCQLLLIGPGEPSAPLLENELDAALAVGGIAGFLLRPGAVTTAAREDVLELAGRLCALCTNHGVAFLLQDDVAAALEVGAAGVHLGTGAADVAASRKALGPERILGVSCRHSRDAAMIAGEAGADYVAFGDLDLPAGQDVYDLLEWWSDLFVLPCLAEVAAVEHECAGLARAGADFVAAGGSWWSHPGEAAAAIRRLREALAAA